MRRAEALLARFAPHWSTPLRERLSLFFHRHPCAKGEALLQQGDRWSRVFLVERGVLRLFFLRPDEREFNKNFIAEGELVCPITPIMWGELSLFGIRSLEDSEVWVADAENFRCVLEAEGLWCAFQCEALSRLIDHKLQREHDLLAYDELHRYEAFRARFPGLAGRVPLSQLATYLGLTDVSLSRIRRRLRGRKRGDQE